MKKIDIPDLKTLLTKGFSVSEIAKKYSLSWTTVKSKAIKLHENGDLLEKYLD